MGTDNIKLKSLRDEVVLFEKDGMKRFSKQKIPTGFKRLDTLLGGGISAGLTVLGAISGLGKSTLMLQIVEHMASCGTPVLYFSLEMSRTMIAAKAISRQLFIDVKCDKEFAISANKLTSATEAARFDADIWKRIDRSRQKVAKKSQMLFVEAYPFDLVEKDAALSAEAICDFVKAYIKTEKVSPVVIVDYLQILPPNKIEFTGSDKQSVDKSVRRIVQLAIKENVPLVAISSLNRASYSQKVQLDSFKETGGIEYSADVILGLSFEDMTDLSLAKSMSPRKVELTALKQRYGSSGSSSTVEMEYFAEFDYFREIESKPKTNLPQKVAKKKRKSTKKKSADKSEAELDPFDKAPERSIL